MTDRSVKAELILKVEQYLANATRAIRATRDIGAEIAKTSKTHQQGWQTMTRGAGIGAAALGAAVGLAVKASMDFEKEMSAVGAVANASGKSLELLRNVALQAGKDTKFSATEAAQGEEELAKAGVSVADIAGGALTGALNLAAAGQISVADAAETTATALNQFGLAGNQASHVADLLSAAANKAQGGVGDMSEALKFVGPVAHQMGVDIEETTGTIAELASKGILGSMAGESLRGMLLSLTSPSQLAAKEMDRLGISVYDAQGQFIGFDGVAGALHDSMKNLTAAERDQAFGRIFGNAQITTARILYEGGAAGVQKWTRSVDDSGNASRTAAAKMDNLAGDLNNLQSSLETALIQGGEGANHALRGLTQAATGAVNQFLDLPGPVQQGAVWLAAVGAAGLGAASAFGFLYPKVTVVREALAAMGAAGEKTNAMLGKAGRAGGVAAAGFATFEIVIAIAKGIQSASIDATPSVNAFTDSLIRLSKSADTGPALDKAFGRNLADFGAELDRMTSPGRITRINDWMNKVGTLGQMKSDSLQEATNDFRNLDDALAGLVTSGHADVAATAFDQLSTRALASGASVDDLRRVLPGYADALQGASNETALAAGGSGKLDTAAKGAAHSLQQEKSAADQLKDALDALNGINMSVEQATIGYAQAQLDSAAALKENGRTVSLNTQKGLANRNALLAQITAANADAEAHANLTQNVDAGIPVLQRHRAELIAVATRMFGNRAAAIAYVDSLLRIPKKVNTNVSIPGATTATAQAQALRDMIYHIPSSKTVRVHYDQLFTSRGNPGGSSDPTLGGILPHRKAEGGFHPAAAGVSPREAAMLSAGPPLYMWREAGGESFIPLERSKRARATDILAQTAEYFGYSLANARPAGSFAGPAPVSAAGQGVGQFTGNLYVEGGGLLGIVRGEIVAHEAAQVRQITDGRRP